MRCSRAPLSTPLVIRDELTGLNVWESIGPLSLCKRASVNEIEEGSKWKLNFHVWLFWFVLVGSELARRVRHGNGS